MENIFCETLDKSLIYMIKKSGPGIDPCGTPHSMPLVEEFWVLYETY